MKKHIFLLPILLISSIFADTSYYFCIDGGGSKTELRVLDSDGNACTIAKGGARQNAVVVGSSNINVLGEEGVREAIGQMFCHLSVEGANKDNSYIVAGMSGASLPANQAKLCAIFQEVGFTQDHITVMTDAGMALDIVGDNGIVLISGTGSICFAKNAGELFRVGGLGTILGDEGSGYRIGLEGIKAALAYEYGWGVETALCESIRAHFNVSEVKQLIPTINQCKMTPADIAKVSELVFKHAYEGDCAAMGVLEKSALALRSLLQKQQEISGLSTCALHLWGGVFKGEHAQPFIESITEDYSFNIVNQSMENPATLYVTKVLLKK